MLLFQLRWNDDGSRETLEQARVLPGGRVLHSNAALPLCLPGKSHVGSPTMTRQDVSRGNIPPPLGEISWEEVLALRAERIQRTIRLFGAEGICGLPAWSWQSYLRPSLVSHGNSPNTPRVAKAGDISVHSLFCHSQILASLPSTCLRVERIKYIHGIIQNKPMG